jgi:hypothetical protein
MSILSRRTAIVGTALLCFALRPSSAAADVITATYAVEIILRCMPLCEPFSTNFELGLTFNDRAQLVGETPEEFGARYGMSTFTGIPASLISGSTAKSHHADTVENVHQVSGGWQRQAVAQRSTWDGEHLDSIFNVVLEASGFVPSRPVLNGRSFAEFLGQGEQRSLHLTGTTDYIGRVALLGEPTSSPTPEPGTLLLIASGIVGAATRRWIRRI